MAPAIRDAGVIKKEVSRGMPRCLMKAQPGPSPTRERPNHSEPDSIADAADPQPGQWLTMGDPGLESMHGKSDFTNRSRFVL